MNVEVKSKIKNYNIIVQKDSIYKALEAQDKKVRAVIITDDGIPEKLLKIVEKQVVRPLVIIVKQGEKAKSIKNVKMIIKKMIEANICRTDYIVALGGGVVGDLAGYIASIYMRGIEYIQIPTTLLAQVDSSVGGKVAINFQKRKNIIGAFYPPKQVVIDSETLKTLSYENILCGLGEIIKYALCFDAEMFNDLLLSEELDFDKYILNCINIKKQIVEADEIESGERKLLNFGHTFAHAIEVVSNYKYTHGEAVVIGMYLIIEDVNIKNQLKKIIKKYGFKFDRNLKKEKIIKAIANDKKAIGNNRIQVVKLIDIGTPKIEVLNIENLDVFLNGGVIIE